MSSHGALVQAPLESTSTRDLSAVPLSHRLENQRPRGRPLTVATRADLSTLLVQSDDRSDGHLHRQTTVSGLAPPPRAGVLSARPPTPLTTPRGSRQLLRSPRLLDDDAKGTPAANILLRGGERTETARSSTSPTGCRRFPKQREPSGGLRRPAPTVRHLHVAGDRLLARTGPVPRRPIRRADEAARGAAPPHTSAGRRQRLTPSPSTAPRRHEPPRTGCTSPPLPPTRSSAPPAPRRRRSRSATAATSPPATVRP